MPAISRLLRAMFTLLGAAASTNLAIPLSILPPGPDRLYIQLVSGMVITIALYWSAEE